MSRWYTRESQPVATDAWVAPDGRWFSVEYAEHWMAADALVADGIANVNPRDAQYGAWTALSRSGWVHISDGRIDEPDGPRVTDAQFSALEESMLVAMESIEAVALRYATRHARFILEVTALMERYGR